MDTLQWLNLSFWVPILAMALWIGFGIAKKNTLGSAATAKGFVISMALGVVGAIWCINYALLPYELLLDDQSGVTFTAWERIVNALLRAARAFGVEEDFDDLLKAAQLMAASLEDSETAHKMLSGYIGVLYVLAPLIGGVGLLQILAGVFPKLHLWFSRMFYWGDKYYFSQLNEKSLALATSLSQVKMCALKRPVLVFTDVEEQSASMIEEAKSIGAICVSSDLLQTQKWGWGKRKFFLIDENETASLQLLVDMTHKKNYRELKKAEVFLFVNSDAYVQVEKNLRDKLQQELQFRETELPVVMPVRCNFNLVSNMLVELPLYESLLKKEKNPDGTRDLVVTILGEEALGVEMFLATYWFGQMLDVNLKVNVVDTGTEEGFWGKIDFVNPEIRRTATRGDSILQIDPAGNMAQPYCQLQYHNCDLRNGSLEGRLEFLDADYVFVALGSDKTNIAVANAAHRHLGERHIAKKHGKTVIAYVVSDTQLSDTLNRKKSFSYAAKEPDVYMQAFGCLRDLYSVRNVFMSEQEDNAEVSFNAYHAMQNSADRAKRQGKRVKNEYNYWADMARGMHLSYKMFSMDLLKTSRFDDLKEEDFLKKRQEEYNRGYRIIGGEIPEDYPLTPEAHVALLHRMSWLEHRRWNAFTRVKGFRHSGDYDLYRQVCGSYKQMDLKLHPCLVECDQKGVRGTVTPEGMVVADSLLKCESTEGFDYLDLLTYDLVEKGCIDYDFKQHDYPYHSLH